GDNSGDGFAGGAAIITLVPTTITGCTFTKNLSRVGDNAPNNGVYGTLYVNNGSTTIGDTTFSGNRAFGGNGGTGQFAGIAQGGAINSFALTTISGSTFTHN